MTRVAWQLRKDVFMREIPGITKKKFLFNLARSSYEKEWGTEYHRPGFRTRLVTLLVEVLPKSGPFRSLAFRPPTPEVEKMFMASFNATIEDYRGLLTHAALGGFVLADENFDLGTVSEAGQYTGSDLTYDKLLDKLAGRKFAGMPPELRVNILAWYADRKPPASVSTQSAAAEWAKVTGELQQLRGSELDAASGQ